MDYVIVAVCPWILSAGIAALSNQLLCVMKTVCYASIQARFLRKEQSRVTICKFLFLSARFVDPSVIHCNNI